MNAPELRLPSGAADWHPSVTGRRINEGVVVAVAGLLCVGIALGIALAMPKPNYPLVVGGIVGLVALVALVTSPRLELTVGGLVFYLGCLNGPLKLISSTGHVGSAIQDVLIIAILVGMLIRQLFSGDPWRLPPLAGLVLAFVAVVVLEAFNPKTLNVLKVGAGFSEQLQFVPFFIFGWLLVRSKARLRKALILVGVIALANGVVATYQTRLSPKQAAAWGEGYANKFEGKASRTYKGEGEGHVRPTGLGDESGAGGGTGVIAIAGTLALLATTRRKRWLLALLTFGAIAAIATGLGRVQLAGGVLAAIGYLLLTGSGAHEFRRPLRLLLVTLAVAVPFTVVFVSALGEGVFSRYSSLVSGGTSSAGYKEDELKAIPKQAAAEPFGFGLGTAGRRLVRGQEHRTVRRPQRHLRDDLQLRLQGSRPAGPDRVGHDDPHHAVARLHANTPDRRSRITGLPGRRLRAHLRDVLHVLRGTRSTRARCSSPFFWFALGVAAYWLAGPGWQAARRKLAADRASSPRWRRR